MRFDLKVPFTYGNKGEQKEAKFIEVHAPNNLVLEEVTIIDQELNKAFFNMLSKNLSDDSSNSQANVELKGSDIIRLMSGCNAEMINCYEALKKILIKTSKVDSEIELTQYLYEKLDYQDTKGLLGEYIKFFLSSSLQA